MHVSFQALQGLSVMHHARRNTPRLWVLTKLLMYTLPCRLVVKLQVEALKAQKNFWEGLLHSEVSFHALAASVARVDETIRQSEQMYKKVSLRDGVHVASMQRPLAGQQAVSARPRIRPLCLTDV